MAVEFVGGTSREIAHTDWESPTTITLDFPPGVQVGDLVVVAEMTFPTTLPDPGPLDGDYPNIHRNESDTAWNRAVWAGLWTGERVLPDGVTPSPISLRGSGYDNVYGMWFRASLWVFRNAVPDYAAQGLSAAPFTPALPFSGGPAIGVSFGRGALGGFSGNPWAETSWTARPVGNTAYVHVGAATHPGPVIAREEAVHRGAGTVWDYFAFAVNTTDPSVAAPLRCFPRDDALGPQAGRAIPPPTTWQHGRRYGGGSIR